MSETRDPVAEALQAVAAAIDNMATSNAIQAETNAILAAQMERLTNSVRGVQGKITSEVGPLIDRAKANAAAALARRAEREVHRGGA